MLKTYIIHFAFFLVLLIFQVGCVDENAKIWKGTIYPGGLGAPNMKFELGNYETLEQCRDAVKIKLKAMKIESIGDYQCRKNCKIDEYGNEDCEEKAQ